MVDCTRVGTAILHDSGEDRHSVVARGIHRHDLAGLKKYGKPLFVVEQVEIHGSFCSLKYI